MIGIFDSGSGGLTVAAALHRLAPHIDVVYFGDLANMPYGEKSVAELENLTFAAIRFLRSHGADFIISACNSVSSSVILPMIEVFGGVAPRIIEMVGPTSTALREINGHITIAATPATVTSGMYQAALQKYGITPHMIPVAGLAAAIEENDHTTIAKKIDEILDACEKNTSQTLLLSCTHYPLVRQNFVAAARTKNININSIDPAEFVVASAITHYGKHGSGTMKFFISKESPQFHEFVRNLFPSRDYTIEITSH